jgi:hypothetical protein
MHEQNSGALPTNGEPETPMTGPVAHASLEEVVPTALVGPAQHKRPPRPIILPRIAAGAAGAAAAGQRATTVLTLLQEAAEEQQPLPPHPAAAGQDRAPTPGSTSPTTIPTPGDLHQTVPFPPVLHRTQQQLRRRAFVLLGVGSLLVAYLVALVLVAVLMVPRVVPYATVTLVPETSTLSTTLEISALPSGTPDPARHEVRARLLSVGSPTHTRTVPTTGTGHAPARAAQGTVTFYNAAPYSQALAAGTVLIGADGVDVMTDVPAVIPAGNAPIEGQVSVPAHAAHIGPQGNIAPLDLNGLCCTAGVSVKNNAAFSGGQYAYDYPIVTQQDVDTVATSLVATGTQQTQASLHQELRPNDRLTGQVQCQPHITPDHAVGSDASQVTVSVSVACHAEVYDDEAVHHLVTDTLTQQALATLGPGYSLHGTSSMIVTQATIHDAKAGTLLLQVHGQGLWAYQVSMGERARLTKLIAGLPKHAAISLMQQQEQGHLAKVHIQFTDWWTDGVTLPVDPTHIYLLVAVGGA